ncbi:MAG: M20/M25/M40 family metallo-hydrolase [Dehalococcoidales bacterium]|nr:M20/M25/M40 family metallo-hydrolase [Dehalococcoidales bacterium]
MYSIDTSIYKRPEELLQNLIRFDTTNPPGNELPLMQYIDSLLTSAGFETTFLAKDPARPNLLTRLKGRGDAPPLLLYGHADVVTTANQKWTYPPFEGRIADGYVWGRGALDMKCGLAMMIASLLRAKAENLQAAGDIIFCAMSDEETGGNYGAKFLVEEHPEIFKDVKYAVSEFGGYTMYIDGKKFYLVQVAEKQNCSVEMTFHGPAGHGSVPVKNSAMSKMGKALVALDEHRLPVHITPVTEKMIKIIASHLPPPSNDYFNRLLDPAQTDEILEIIRDKTANFFDPLLHNTVNAIIVQGGEKINVVPGEVALYLDGRILPGFSDNDLIDELRQIAGKDCDIKISMYEAVKSHIDLKLFDMLSDILKQKEPECIPIPIVIGASTDAKQLAKLGIQTYGYLPIDLPQGFDFMKSVHAADERIPVKAMYSGTDAIYQVISRYEK